MRNSDNRTKRYFGRGFAVAYKMRGNRIIVQSVTRKSSPREGKDKPVDVLYKNHSNVYELPFFNR